MLLVLLVLLVLQILQMLLIYFNGCRCIYSEFINTCLFWDLSLVTIDPVSSKKSKFWGKRSDLRHLKYFFKPIPVDSLPRLDSGQRLHNWSMFLFPAFLQACHKASAADPGFSAGA